MPEREKCFLKGSGTPKLNEADALPAETQHLVFLHHQKRSGSGVEQVISECHSERSEESLFL
jgi:hypothetical protein